MDILPSMGCLCLKDIWSKNMGNKTTAIRKPKLIIFDLNYTLWKANVTCHESKPFTRDRDGRVVDSQGREVMYFPEVPDMLELLQKEGYTMAVASRYGWPEEDRSLLEMFELEDYFTFKEIYVGEKTEHFRNIHKKSGVKYDDMLFFDDSQVNIRNVSELGVHCVYVRQGMSFEVLGEGLEKFAGLYPLASPKEKPKNAVIKVQHLLKSRGLSNNYTKLK